MRKEHQHYFRDSAAVLPDGLRALIAVQAGKSISNTIQLGLPLLKQTTYICKDCWATVTVEVDGADITYSAKGSRITIHREGAETLLGRLKWVALNRSLEELFPQEDKCPACKPFGLIP